MIQTKIRKMIMTCTNFFQKLSWFHKNFWGNRYRIIKDNIDIDYGNETGDSYKTAMYKEFERQLEIALHKEPVQYYTKVKIEKLKMPFITHYFLYSMACHILGGKRFMLMKEKMQKDK